MAPGVKAKKTKVKRPGNVVHEQETDASSGSTAAPELIEEMELLNPGGGKRRKVLVLYTGGTMGMQVMANGGLGLKKGELLKMLRGLTELNSERMPQCYIAEFKTILDSADMTMDDWSNIASVIGEHYYEFDGFVVIHGTDTMCYTASALSFMLEQLAKPVVVTGSQLPFLEPLSDARQNFLGSVVFAGLADICEVCLFFNGMLLRGTRARKTDATSLQPFQSAGYPLLGEVGVDVNVHHEHLQRPPRGCFRFHRIASCNILVMWLIPGFSDAFLKNIAESTTIKGLVMLLYGCGNAPARKKTFLGYLKTLVDKDVVVVGCSQCTSGTVCLEKYAVGKAFQDCGVLGAMDMTPEATITKLSYLLSKNLSPAKVRQLMQENLRGEVTLEGHSRLHIEEPVTGLSHCL